jgi:hypothetical protein
MAGQVGAVAVQVLGRRQVVGLELAAVREKQLMASGGELLDGRAADEPRAAEDYYLQPLTPPWAPEAPQGQR